jgi:hypothetical protein
MPDDLVTVTTYMTAYEAHIAKACLEEAGIDVFLQDVHTVGLRWDLSNLIGGVKLQVPSADAERATEILAQTTPVKKDFNPFADNSEKSVCLSCGQHMPDDVDQCPKCGWTFRCSDE